MHVRDEGADDVAMMSLPGLACLGQPRSVEADDLSQARVPVDPPRLLALQRLEPRQVLAEARAQEIVLQHVAERRCERHGERDRDRVLRESIEHADERQVTLEDGLEQPALLEVTRVLGMAHVGEVRVEDDCEIAGGHAGPCRLAGLRWIAPTVDPTMFEPR